ncbi:MAG: inorganic phosphate transporter [Bacteroidia bacterium]|nr:inorganic phosphate transporter [Bacteroidia bacterium]
MENMYLVLVIVLFALAITDLVVGVSNDAVNFLNSAIGSKVTSMRTIMIVASVGIFIGATFSSGMMEVARKSIFHPEAFTFAEIMAVFVAVMLTDIILLDFFNSIGLPTSTTVSIVFELLGAATTVALIKMTAADEGLSHLSSYINGETALTIVSGILLSVVIAFVFGALIQYLSRILFSFQYEKRLKYFGSVWGGLALTAMTYFLIIKGLKHASFVSDAQNEWMKEHTLTILGASLVLWTLILQLLASFTKFNILKIVVLFGTFALAMAFAGNDLVNFIGVPIAGMESFFSWRASNMSPDELMMTSLAEPVKTNPWLLLIAGLIMVLTLWGSRKARSVVETSLKLSRQNEGAERFRPSFFSQTLVRFSYMVSSALVKGIPLKTLEKIDKNFQPLPLAKTEKDPVAFDLIRASVNLAVASMLISLATSLKLPLSTTYVTFMVAMGASLADKAWGRDSAVYRVAGVVQVVAGWFGTALIAFTVCSVFVVLILLFGMYAVGGLMALAILLMVRSHISHNKESDKTSKMDKMLANNDTLSRRNLHEMMARDVKKSLESARAAMSDAFNGLMEEDLTLIRKSKKDIRKLTSRNERTRYHLFQLIKRSGEDSNDLSTAFVKVFDLDQDLAQSAELIVKACVTHIENTHAPLVPSQEVMVRSVADQVGNFIGQLAVVLGSQKTISAESLELYLGKKNEILILIEDAIQSQNEGIRLEKYNSRNSLLVFSLLMEARDLVVIAARFAKLFASISPELEEKDHGPDPLLTVASLN